MKLWVDDERPAPDEWLSAVSSDLAIGMLMLLGMTDTPVTEISLDHDLGGEDTTRRVVMWLCENPDYWPAAIHVHTMNSVGAEWLIGMINRYGPGVASRSLGSSTTSSSTFADYPSGAESSDHNSDAGNAGRSAGAHDDPRTSESACDSSDREDGGSPSDDRC